MYQSIECVQYFEKLMTTSQQMLIHWPLCPAHSSLVTLEWWAHKHSWILNLLVQIRNSRKIPFQLNPLSPRRDRLKNIEAPLFAKYHPSLGMSATMQLMMDPSEHLYMNQGICTRNSPKMNHINHTEELEWDERETENRKNVEKIIFD